MIKLMPVKNRLCALGNSYDVIADACRDRSGFFSFLESRELRIVRRCFAKYLDKPNYPICYCFVLIFSLYGVIHSLIQFTMSIRTKRGVGSSGNQKVRRRIRMAGAFIQINIWTHLLYAALLVSPNHMTPWLCVHLGILVCKLTAATIKGHFRCQGDLRARTTINAIVYVLVIGLVYLAMRSFTAALARDVPENLRLCLKFINPLLNYVKGHWNLIYPKLISFVHRYHSLF
ncbi:uncharacterized protein LOC117141281 isoform X1 [Drosophila mauritiana]|uniref:Uncharacterized protein LOC117141281 isoform X1 n=1 Tax=Drosophila mauritiana TaxID=7226 RepID=A0A6P8JUQ8_DROMA|nr:uncharacterized protein LOC117141281 isoform X1 [Drosophila mauritiana]